MGYSSWPELPAPRLRLLLGVGIVVLAVVQVHVLLQTLQAETALRAAVLRVARQAATGALPELMPLARSGGRQAGERLCARAVQLGLASEAELFRPNGERLAAYPLAAPVEHWPPPADLARIEAGGVLAYAPGEDEAAPRQLTYAPLPCGDAACLLRLANPAEELALHRVQRRQLLVSHVIALALTALLLVVTVALPGATGRPAPPASALAAYEEAVERLGHDRAEQSRQHAAERERLVGVLRDREAMARAGELTAGIVHELRNGLGTILGYARLVERSASEPRAGEAARAIAAECETLESVIRRFVDFVRLDALSLEAVELRRLLERVAAREQRTHPAVRLDLALDAAPRLRADEGLLERALENLVRNALEAAAPRGRVRVRAAIEDGAAVVRIADDGPGLASGGAAALRPFATTKPGGLGLGLPMAQKIVELHGGTLGLGAASPRGVEAVVRLPLNGPEA